MEEVEIKISDRISVRVRPLNMAESMQADEYVGNTASGMKVSKVYSLCSVRALKGPGDNDFVPVNPLANAKEMLAVASKFNTGEGQKLLMEVGKLTEADMDETLKNELTALA